jgi:hypothetical protein
MVARSQQACSNPFAKISTESFKTYLFYNFQKVTNYSRKYKFPENKAFPDKIFSSFAAFLQTMLSAEGLTGIWKS